MIEEIEFEIPREHKKYTFTIETDEQLVYLDLNLRHPEFLPQNPLQELNMIISRTEFHEDLNNFLKKIIISVQKIDTEFLQTVHLAICNDHIGKFGRLWYNDLLMYTDLYVTIDRAIFNRPINHSQSLYRRGVYNVLTKFPKKVLFPSPMGGHYSWDDV